MLRENLDDILADSEAQLLEPREVFDPCVIGLAERPNLMVVAYDTAKVIQALMDHYDMDQDDADEWFHFNILGAWNGEGTPVFVDLLAE